MKLQLDTSQMTEDFYEEFRLVGVVAPIPDYRFCWQINQVLEFNFRLDNDIDIHLEKKGRKYFYPVYKNTSSARQLEHLIFKNQDDGEFLLPEFRHIDFLWMLRREYVADDELQELIAAIRSLQVVQMAVELKREKIRNKEHLIF